MDRQKLPFDPRKFDFGGSFVHRSLFQKMAVYYSTEKIIEITTQYGGNASNTGNTEVQVALLTYRIECLSAHLRQFKKDHSTRRRLLSMVAQRKGLLSYYAKKDIYKYRALIEKLGLRK